MYKGKYVTAIIAAAGMGKRMQIGYNKQFLKLNNKPILAHTLNKIDSCEYVDFIIILIRQSDINYIGSILNKFKLKNPYKIVYGGKERQDSMRNGLLNLPSATEIILTHDGARPFVNKKKIKEIIEKVNLTGAATLANMVKDTIKVSINGKIADYTLNRNELWAIQTPQVFNKNILLKAYKQAYSENYYGTDDCSLVEKNGGKVILLNNDYTNIKITTPEDLILAKAILNKL